MSNIKDFILDEKHRRNEELDKQYQEEQYFSKTVN